MNSNTELIIYTTDDGVTKVEATFDGDTVWLSQEQMGELFQRDKSTISRHIRNIFTEGELDEKVVVAEIATTTQTVEKALLLQGFAIVGTAFLI